MQVILRIKKNELELIKSGVKTEDWRACSKYNKDLLLVFGKDKKRIPNPEIVQIKFINGYGPQAPSLTVKVKRIRPVKFQTDVEKPEMNLYGKEGATVIVIELGAIVK